jgi:hypothetical protein
MPKYLITVDHENEMTACMKTIKVFLETGSHFVSNADWGCKDDVHTAWLSVDAKNKDEARMILPPAYRQNASITTLAKFTLDEVNGIIKNHVKKG